MSSIRQKLENSNLAPKKKLGQNFLVHQQTAERIVDLAEITREDTIIELGVGLGALTVPLAAAARRVIGLELDAGIVRWWKNEGKLPGNVTLMHQDLLKADFNRLAEESGTRLKIMANLPYSISNPLLFKLYEEREAVDWAVLMLQKEVGQRLIALPGSKEYGILSVLLAGTARVKKLMNVGPAQFHPRPRVDSVVVHIRFHPRPERAANLPPHDEKLLKNLVNAGFQQRRKTLVNALAASSCLQFSKKTITVALAAVGLDPRVRAERLTTENFVELARELSGR
jgi:16S rRNA (adenine1518-N6/adenine1519-N6)-dimethyltransferase